jgi:hypothetical protein
MIKRNYFYTLLLLLAGPFFTLQTSFAQSQATEVFNQPVEAVDFSRFRISIDGGLGYLIGSTKTAKAQMKNYGISELEADRYYREIKLGEQAGASVYYLLNPKFGLGLDYSFFTTNSSVLGYLDPGDGWTRYYGKFSEKIYTNFVGVSYFQDRKINEKWHYYGKLSVGVAFYRNEAHIIVLPTLLIDTAPAIQGESGFSYSLSKHISIGLSISDFFSSLRKIKVNNGTNTNEVKLEGDMKENLSRLSVSTGLQFHF